MKSMKRNGAPGKAGFFSALLWVLALPGASLASEAEASELHDARTVRGIWLTRWDYKTEADVRRAIRWCAAYGLNRVFFQVRGRADAFYRSSLEPWGEEIGGEDPGFDPLEVALSQARAEGIELHAWVNVLPAWKGDKPPRSPAHVFHRHPEWFLVDRLGTRHMSHASDYTILNPCLPEVRAYLVTVIEDLASRYAVDGMHLDYMRFVARDAAAGRDFSYDPTSLALFRRYAGGSPFELPDEWERWRKLAVNTLVFRLSEAVRQARPGACVSVAAIKDYERAREGLFQDVVAWQRHGWIDEVYPMSYERDGRAFASCVRRILSEAPAGAKVYPGVGAHLLTSTDELSRQIETVRNLGANGYCLFAFASFFPSCSHESKKDPESRHARSVLRKALLSIASVPDPDSSVPPAPRTPPRRGARTAPAGAW